MKKFKLAALLLAASVFGMGCGVGGGGQTDGKTAQTNSGVAVDKGSEPSEGEAFPVKYEAERERVFFQCELENPEGFNTKSLHKETFKNSFYPDPEKAYQVFVGDKNVEEKHTTPPDGDIPEENYYIMEDGSSLGIGNSLSHGTLDFQRYSQIGVYSDEYRQIYMRNQVSFAQPEACIQEVKDKLSEIGYQADNFEFASYPLSVEDMKAAEEGHVQAGLLEEGLKNKEWTSQDEAYYIYAFQKAQGLPVFHKLMNIGQQMAFDTPDSAPIQAIYSARGLEYLSVMEVYDLEETQESVALKDFEEIAAVLEEKYNSILNDAKYTVNRAKLYEMVRTNQEQEEEVLPVWYFEVAENDTTKSVALVDAQTGREIYIK